MHCSQARRKLAAISAQPADPELLEHLQHCAKCARLAEAARLLDKALATAKEDPLDLPSLAMLQAGVERRLRTGTTPAREYRFMSAIKQQFKKRPHLGLGLGIAAVALILLTLIPFTVEKTIGYEVAFAGVDERLALDENRFTEFLTQLGIEHANYDVSDCDKVCNVKITELQSEADAQILVAAFRKMQNVMVLDGVEACQENVRCSAIEWVGNSVMFGSNVSLTDEELDNILIERIGDSTAYSIFVSKDGSFDAGGNFIFMDENSPHDVSFMGGDSITQLEITCLPDSMGLQCVVSSWGDSSGQVACYLFGGEFEMHDAQDMTSQLEQVLAEVGLTLADIHSALSEEMRRKLAEAGITYQIIETPDGDQKTEFWVTQQESAGEQHGDSDTEAEAEPLAKEGGIILPEGFTLEQNYPNPFNPTTTIEYEIATPEHVTLDIINVTGQVVRHLVDDYQGAGVHTVQWNATDDGGARVASGIYFYRISAGEFSQTKRMMLVK